MITYFCNLCRIHILSFYEYRSTLAVASIHHFMHCTYTFSFYAHTYRLFCLLQFFCPLFCNWEGAIININFSYAGCPHMSKHYFCLMYPCIHLSLDTQSYIKIFSAVQDSAVARAVLKISAIKLKYPNFEGSFFVGKTNERFKFLSVFLYKVKSWLTLKWQKCQFWL